ncbi:MAG: type IV secretion system DNA-binding domain-containing protein [Candidatus Nealsonbacteria bacterium DGGOD1a]|nr:MAG: type IV secretion system DNA-binding domain-containing protein [Candidatus Nealsonbacteria bacterium DGGOD1a]
MAQKEKIIYIGEVSWRNQRTKFGIKTDDRRRHMYLVGKTGMGKSNLLENMAIQDIQAGNGIAFIDPHGEAAEKLLDYIPSHRVNDVIYFNPGDVAFPTAFNVMEITNPEHRNLIAAGLMAVFKKIWPDVWSARMEYILNNTILALLEYPNSTLLGINRMFSDAEFRAKVVEKVTDPIIRAFWVNEYAKYNQKYEQESTAAIQNKIGQFIANPLMRNIIGQVKSSIDIRKIMDEKKILIVNISKGMVGEDASRLFGAMVITKLQLAAMSRQNIPEEQRTDFYCYVDEFQNFATDSFVNILSEARKYRLSLILANQYLGQLEEMGANGKSSRVKDAVFGNVGTIITFRVGAEDAEFLEPEFTPEITIEDFVNLGKYHIYLKLMIDGITSAPFSAITLPPMEKGAVSEKEKIIRASRERYSVAREVIEEKIAKWSGEMNEAAAKTPGMPADGQSQTKMHEITCSMCGKKTKVIFEPEPGRKVYCKPCLKKLQNDNARGNGDVAAKTDNYAQKTGDNGDDRRQQKSAPEISASAPISAPPRISLSDLARANPVRFAGQKNDSPGYRPKKEVRMDELKKALNEALGGAADNEKSEK